MKKVDNTNSIFLGLTMHMHPARCNIRKIYHYFSFVIVHAVIWLDIAKVNNNLPKIRSLCIEMIVIAEKVIFSWKSRLRRIQIYPKFWSHLGEI